MLSMRGVRRRVLKSLAEWPRYPALAMLGSLALFAASVAVGGSARGSSAVVATQVITFRPAVPAGPQQKGSCWTDSVAVDRPGAWRCMVGNSIYDPCFTNPELTDGVICDADPSSDKPGFVLKLTKPLPPPTSKRRPNPLPWLLKLADGSVCELSTGTIVSIGRHTIPYQCSDSAACREDGKCPYLTGLTDDLKSGKVWKAEKFAFRSSKGGARPMTHKWIPVVTVWK